MASKAPSTKALLKIFWMFDKHGLIKEDLCFDPEQLGACRRTGMYLI